MPNDASPPTELAAAFATALDRGDWAAARDCLEARAEYRFRGGVTRGPAAIVDSYRRIDAWVRATFEDVRYASEIVADDDRAATITFRDHMALGEHTLDFACRQRVTLGDHGRIATIEHIDIPGEPEKAAAFNRACGVTKPDSA